MKYHFVQCNLSQQQRSTEVERERVHLVYLGGFVEHAGVNGCHHQVVGSCDGMDIASEVEVELESELSYMVRHKRRQ